MAGEASKFFGVESAARGVAVIVGGEEVEIVMDRCGLPLILSFKELGEVLREPVD